MKYPTIWQLNNLLRSAGTVQASTDGNTWHHARPAGYPSIKQRIKAAWLVFTGKADAVVWPEGQ